MRLKLFTHCSCLSSLNAGVKWLLRLVCFRLTRLLTKKRIFRDRTHPFDTDIRWWIHFQENQIHSRRYSDHNWLHWEGHCDQQSDRFLKLTPLSEVSLFTRMPSPQIVVSKVCVARWLGWVKTVLFRDLVYLQPPVGSVSLPHRHWLSQ